MAKGFTKGEPLGKGKDRQAVPMEMEGETFLEGDGTGTPLTLLDDGDPNELKHFDPNGESNPGTSESEQPPNLDEKKETSLDGETLSTNPPNMDEKKEIPSSGETPPVVPPKLPELPLFGSYAALPADHPIHDLAQRAWEGTDQFEAFHAVRPDGTHLFIDINRFVGVEKVTGGGTSDQLKPWTKIQTGSLAAVPELGRMSDWLARASVIAGHAVKTIKKGIQLSYDGTHAIFLKNILLMRTRASINACNSAHKAGFSEMIDPTTDPNTIKTPFPIDKNDLLRRYFGDVSLEDR